MTAPNTIRIDEVEYIRRDAMPASISPVPGDIKIVVLDRGFVYIGRVSIEEGTAVIRNARNIRVWGTSKGMGELALEGPKSGTKLDDVGTVRAPMHAVIHFIDVDQSKWTRI